jgi:hypothetical protein
MKEPRTQSRRRRVLAALAVGSAVVVVTGACTVRPPTGTPQPPPTWGPAPTAAPTTDGHGHTDEDHANMTTTTVPRGVDCGKGRYVAPGSGGGGGGGHDHGDGGHAIPDRLNHPPTPQQEAWARDLIARTKAYIDRNIPTTAEARRLGYNPIGDGGRHWTNARFRLDGCEFDERKIESLVVEGGRVTAAMYNMEPSTTIENVPDWAGNWIVWHNHNNLCWKAPVGQPGWTELELTGRVVNGTCTRGYIQNPPVLMVHVWTRRHVCGAFAGDGATRASAESSCLPNLQAPGV